MSKEARWFGAAVGVSAGIFVWVLGLNKSLWPAHSEWILLAVVAIVTVVSTVLIQRGERRSRDHVRRLG